MFHLCWSYVRNYYYCIANKPQLTGIILMLHRVCDKDDNRLFPNENMKVSPSVLDAFLRQAKEKYDFVRLEEVPERMKARQTRPFMAFTMDDGYFDNYTNALPIFKKYNIPYTIFVTTDFPDREAILWWYVLEDLLFEYPELKLSNGISYPSRTFEEKMLSFMAIRSEILKLDQFCIEKELGNLFPDYNIDWKGMCKSLCLSWDDIVKLKNEPLVTLGAHTQHHCNLKQLKTIDDVKSEVMSGVNILAKHIGSRPSVFAYPFGTANESGEREFKALSELDDIILSVRSCGGPVTDRHSDLYSLPRIMLTDKTKISDFRFFKGVYVD